MSWLQRFLQTSMNSNLLDAKITTWFFKSFRYDSSSTQNQINETSTFSSTSFMKTIAHSSNFRRELRIRILTTSDVRYRRSRSFCSRTCIRREHSTSTIILNSATILESIFVMTARKHIQEFDINNDVSLFTDKRQFRCQAMTTTLDVWTRSLYCREFCAITSETETSYFWFVTSTVTSEDEKYTVTQWSLVHFIKSIERTLFV